jgi:hypothetical protein
VEVRGEGRVHVPSVPGGAEDLLGEGDVILTDEEGSSGGCQAVQGGAGDGEGVEPEFVQVVTSKMKGGFPVRIIERDDVNR